MQLSGGTGEGEKEQKGGALNKPAGRGFKCQNRVQRDGIGKEEKLVSGGKRGADDVVVEMEVDDVVSSKKQKAEKKVESTQTKEAGPANRSCGK
jgi:hypothetical protein